MAPALHAIRTFRSVDISSFARGEFKYSSGAACPRMGMTVMASHGIPWHPMAQVLYNEVAYFTPYGADHVGVFDLKTERFGAMAGTM